VKKSSSEGKTFSISFKKESPEEPPSEDGGRLQVAGHHKKLLHSQKKGREKLSSRRGKNPKE